MYQIRKVSITAGSLILSPEPITTRQIVVVLLSSMIAALSKVHRLLQESTVSMRLHD
jgi:hypothetical protein